MTDEEMARMERNMQFIVEQQAQFAADIQQIKEVLSSHNQAIVSVVGMVGRLADIQSEFQKNAGTRFARLEDKVTGLAGTLAEYGELAKGTEGRLNAFISYVEKYISIRDGENKRKKRSH
jgi:hypothetical protein